MNVATYADRAWQGTIVIDENVRLARDTYRLRARCPRIASAVLPGQFVMLRLAGQNDPLLGRPLAVYNVVNDAQGQPTGVDIVYLVVGKMTERLARLAPGALLEIWGPLGNGFPSIEADHLVLVAGGIGQTPLLLLAEEHCGTRGFGYPPRRVAQAKQVTLCYGVRTQEYLAGVEDFERLGVQVHVSTDDGSVGHHGLVTDLVAPVIAKGSGTCRIACCGPEPMMRAVAALAEGLGVGCHLSLETPMACGVGACFSCVAKVRDGAGGWDYRRTCVEGPVFDARDIEF